MGYALDAAESLDLAASVFERVKESRPFEPQSYRDLANVWARQFYSLMARCANANASGAEGSVTPADVLTGVPALRDAVEVKLIAGEVNWGRN